MEILDSKISCINEKLGVDNLDDGMVKLKEIERGCLKKNKKNKEKNQHTA